MKSEMSSFIACTAVLAVCALSPCMAQQSAMTGAGPGMRYATDAYPGFDSEDGIVNPEKKEPKWFSFINGPKMGDSRSQLRFCRELISAGSRSRACKGLDALVREWPMSPEAPAAQLLLADTLSEMGEYEDAFAEYRYLLDFYSLACDYSAISEKAYNLANVLREEGKSIIWFRFDNTVDVRRAYESLVLRAPGAAFAPEAMLTIGALREDEGKYEQAVQVYENLRNLYPQSKEAAVAVRREADSRMTVLREREYNRSRCKDTAGFLASALTMCGGDDVRHIRSLHEEVLSMLEDDAYRSAKFYDSRVRTSRSAVSAYERFLADYPRGKYADEVRRRLEELKGDLQK